MEELRNRLRKAYAVEWPDWLDVDAEPAKLLLRRLYAKTLCESRLGKLLIKYKIFIDGGDTLIVSPLITYSVLLLLLTFYSYMNPVVMIDGHRFVIRMIGYQIFSYDLISEN